MAPTPVLDALLTAHAQRATGALRLSVCGSESRLLFRDGDLVGAELTFGYQTPAQALLAAGHLEAARLDALWARGRIGSKEALREASALTEEGLAELQVLASVRRAVELAESAELEARDVDVGFPLIPGARVVRAALLRHPQEVEAPGRAEVLPSAPLPQPPSLNAERARVRGPEEVPPGLPPRNTAPAQAPLLSEPGDFLGAPPDMAALRAALARAQDEHRREVQEALRRSGSFSTDAWLQDEQRAPPAPLSEPEMTLELTPGDAEMPELPPDAIVAVSEGELGPEATAQGGSADEDLWRIVTFDARGADDIHSSFEEALARVDVSLERLIGGHQGPPVPQPPLELEFEAVEAPQLPFEAAWRGDASGWLEELGDPAEWDDEDDVEGDPTDPVEAARRRRQRLLRRAMENLGTLSPRPAAEAGTVEAPSDGLAPSPSPQAASSSGEEARFAQLLEQRYLALGMDTRQGLRDHFKVLGVPPTATSGEVKAAFLGLAKIFHPDRLPPTLGHLRSKMMAVFGSIREAYEILYDDARRTAYVASLRKPQAAAPGPAPARDGAEEEARKGELALRRRDYVAAEECFARAHALQPRPVYLAARAWALYMDPARKGEVARARQWMQEALTADPDCDRAHYQLGVIARVEGDMGAAERHFREAVRANPRHLEANQELRLIEMRRKKGHVR